MCVCVTVLRRVNAVRGLCVVYCATRLPVFVCLITSLAETKEAKERRDRDREAAATLRATAYATLRPVLGKFLASDPPAAALPFLAEALYLVCSLGGTHTFIHTNTRTLRLPTTFVFYFDPHEILYVMHIDSTYAYQPTIARPPTHPP